MIQFFQTIMGKKFFEADVPRLLTVLGRIADSLEMLAVETKIANDIAEKGRGPQKETP
jgi:hypothetical protein